MAVARSIGDAAGTVGYVFERIGRDQARLRSSDRAIHIGNDIGRAPRTMPDADIVEPAVEGELRVGVPAAEPGIVGEIVRATVPTEEDRRQRLFDAVDIEPRLCHVAIVEDRRDVMPLADQVGALDPPQAAGADVEADPPDIVVGRRNIQHQQIVDVEPDRHRIDRAAIVEPELDRHVGIAGNPKIGCLQRHGSGVRTGIVRRRVRQHVVVGSPQRDGGCVVGLVERDRDRRVDPGKVMPAIGGAVAIVEREGHRAVDHGRVASREADRLGKRCNRGTAGVGVQRHREAGALARQRADLDEADRTAAVAIRIETDDISRLDILALRDRQGIADLVTGGHRRGQRAAIVIGAVDIAGRNIGEQRNRAAACGVGRRQIVTGELRRVVDRRNIDRDGGRRRALRALVIDGEIGKGGGAVPVVIRNEISGGRTELRDRNRIARVQKLGQAGIGIELSVRGQARDLDRGQPAVIVGAGEVDGDTRDVLVSGHRKAGGRGQVVDRRHRGAQGDGLSARNRRAAAVDRGVDGVARAAGVRADGEVLGIEGVVEAANLEAAGRAAEIRRGNEAQHGFDAEGERFRCRRRADVFPVAVLGRPVLPDALVRRRMVGYHGYAGKAGPVVDVLEACAEDIRNAAAGGIGSVLGHGRKCRCADHRRVVGA